MISVCAIVDRRGMAMNMFMEPEMAMNIHHRDDYLEVLYFLLLCNAPSLRPSSRPICQYVTFDDKNTVLTTALE